jgi:ATP-binding cassette, subfamily B, bacterial MsbA
MKNLFRALKKALKYRWSLAVSFGCSLMVAILWGANIGAVYPFIEVIFHGKSFHQWVDEEVQTANNSILTLRDENRQLEDQLRDPKLDDEERSQINTQIWRNDAAIEAEQAKASRSEMLSPLIKKYLPNGAFETLLVLTIFLVIGTIFRGLFLMANMILVARIGQRTVLDLQNEFFDKTLQLELQAIGKKGTGDLVGRIRGETGAIGSAITTLFGKTLREPLKMIACLTGAALVNWRLLVLSMLVCPLALVVMFSLARLAKRANKKAVEESARLMNRLFQAVTYIKIVKAFTMEKYEHDRFRTVARDVYKKGMKIARYVAIARMNNELTGICVICCSLLAGGYLVLNEKTVLFGIQMSATPITVSQMMLFYAFLVGVSDPLRKMGDVYTNLQGGMVAADRVFPMIDQVPKIADPHKPVPVPAKPLKIRFENVTFGYDPNQPVVDDVSFEIPAGTSVGIVGANGCGKSSLVNLLPRFFDPQAGTITLNDVSIRQFRLQELRKSIGYVTQQTMLFNDSIINNIRYGTPDATEQQVIEAAEQAHAHAFIMANHRKGYRATTGEHGGKLSGGQRQRLALARAILKNPPVLLLDEATSQIDPESEILIHKALAQFMKGRTTIIITHRLSTLDLVDQIMVMDQGKIVDMGTHETLMNRCQSYRRLRSNVLSNAA